MAGIAFRLQKLLSGESYTDLVRAYLYSSVIAAGPFLVVIASLGFLRMGANQELSLESTQLFMGWLVYAYAFSMLGVAPFLYVVTRFLADKYFLKQITLFTPAYLSVLEMVFALQAAVVFVYLYPLALSLAIKVLLFNLYLILSGIWIAMIFLSAARHYFWIVVAFFAGGVSGVVGAMLLGKVAGITGFLLGFTLGQVLCFLILTVRIFFEFGYTMTHDFAFLTYFKKYPMLCGIGIFYYLGIWVDKFIFWFSPLGETIAPRLKIFSDYDIPLFLAYLSVIPSMAFFLVQMETSFVQYYHAYYQSIRKREGLDQIRLKRGAMMHNIASHFQKFVLFQGALSGVVIIFIYRIADAFYLNPAQMGIMRIGLLGAFLQMGFLMIVNILFYFDLQKDILWLTFLFLVSNVVFTLMSYYIGLPAYGYGYAMACFVAVFFGFLRLDDRLKKLDYITFMKQPILIPKFKFEAESK